MMKRANKNDGNDDDTNNDNNDDTQNLLESMIPDDGFCPHRRMMTLIILMT